MRDSFPDQFITIKGYRIRILVVDLLPECLELRLGKVLVQRVLFHLGFMAVHNHILEGTFIIDSLNQQVDTLCHRCQIFRQRRGCPQLDIRPVLICHFALHIHIAITDEVELNGVGYIIINLRRHTVDLDILTLEVLTGCSGGAVVQFLLDIALQVCHKVLVAFAGNDRKQIDVMHSVATALHIHTIAILVYAQTQTTANFLTLGGLAIGMFQRANLKHIRVIPAFPKGRVGEDEPGRFLKGE